MPWSSDPTPLRQLVLGLALALVGGALVLPLQAQTGAPLPEAADQAFEQLLASSLGDNRGVTLLVNGQSLSGLVMRVQPGQWVELRTPQQGRIVVRLPRIDAVIRP